MPGLGMSTHISITIDGLLVMQASNGVYTLHYRQRGLECWRHIASRSSATECLSVALSPVKPLSVVVFRVGVRERTSDFMSMSKVVG